MKGTINLLILTAGFLNITQVCAEKDSVEENVTHIRAKRITRPSVLVKNAEGNYLKENSLATIKEEKHEDLSSKHETSDPQDICEHLMQLGDQYETQNQLQRAMDCYRAVSVMDEPKARQAIAILKTRMLKETEKDENNEEMSSLERGARQGNADDAYKLGKIYFHQDKIENAVQMWKISSENKHVKAPHRLAVMFEKGEQVPLDLAQAEHFYRLGAQNGNPDCAYVVSKLLELDAQRDPSHAQQITTQAFQLKLEAADRGHAVAAAEIGYLYASKGDHVKAKRYFLKAQKKATPNSTMTVSVAKIMGYNVASEDFKISNHLQETSLKD